MARKQLERNDRHFSRVMRRDGSVCQYCGGTADSVDHVLPVSYFSDNSLVNLVAACMPCNLAASSFVFDSFEAKQAFIRKRRKISGTPPTLAVEPDDNDPDDDDDPDGEPWIVDAVWEELPEADEPDEDEPDDEPWLSDPDYADALCGGITKKGTPCKQSKALCLLHPWPSM
jgi:hypothetical protein